MRQNSPRLYSWFASVNDLNPASIKPCTATSHVNFLLHQAGGAGTTEAAVNGDAAALQAQLDEQQAEFNDLLACLGQESAKVDSQTDLRYRC